MQAPRGDGATAESSVRAEDGMEVAQASGRAAPEGQDKAAEVTGVHERTEKQ